MRAQPRALNGQRTGRGGEGSFPVLRVRERRRGTRPYLRTGNGKATSSPPLKPTNLLKIIGLSLIKALPVRLRASLVPMRDCLREKICSFAGCARLLGLDLRNSFAVFSWVGRAEIHPGGEIPLDSLSAAHRAGIPALHLELVPHVGELIARVRRKPALDEQVAAGEGVFRKAWRFERGLNVHFE